MKLITHTRPNMCFNDTNWFELLIGNYWKIQITENWFNKLAIYSR